MMPFPGLLEPLTESAVLGAVGCLLLHYMFGVNAALFLGCHFTFWFVCDMLLLRIIEVSDVGLGVDWDISTPHTPIHYMFLYSLFNLVNQSL